MRSGNFTYALLGLVSGKPHGIHGYRLLSEVEALADDFWQLNYGSLYRALDWLARRSDLEIHEDASGLRPPRKVYKITASGEATLATWLVQPIPDKPRPLRDELALKLLFLRTSRLNHVADLITRQKSIYASKISKLTRRRRKLEQAGMPADAVTIVIEREERRLRFDLEWLDELGRYALRRF